MKLFFGGAGALSLGFSGLAAAGAVHPTSEAPIPERIGDVGLAAVGLSGAATAFSLMRHRPLQEAPWAANKALIGVAALGLVTSIAAGAVMMNDINQKHPRPGS